MNASAPSKANFTKQPGSQNFLQVENPATGQFLAELPQADEDAIDLVAMQAAAAFEHGSWRNLTFAQRGEIMHRAADHLEREAGTLSEILVAETGLPIRQVSAMHIKRSAENFRFFATDALNMRSEIFETPGSYTSTASREPIGVVALIVPWNAPTVLASIKLAAALMTGNSVIIKPSEYAPLAVARLVEILHLSGVPKDVLHCVHGGGQPTGDALVNHSAVGAVSFIGGTETGRAVLRSAAKGLKKVGLELGGKNASIVLADCDIEKAVAGHMVTMFAGNAEQCLSASRILVEDGIADQFIAELEKKTAALVVGDPMDPQTDIGPLAFSEHLQRVEKFAELARSDGGYTVLAEARLPSDQGNGHYFAPMLVETQSNDALLNQQEVFGPIVVIQRVRDLDDAIARANQSEFGLGAYLWTADQEAIAKASKKLRVGTVWVNTVMTRDLRAPFGGYKNSGLGRDGIAGLLDLLTEEKTVIVAQQI